MRHFKRRGNGGEPPFVDPAFADALAGKSGFEDAFGSDGRAKRNHKALQLCRQVQRILTLSLGTGSGDEVLGEVYVSEVTPAPDASHLMVHVVVPGGVSVVEVLERLGQVTPRLRAEVARGITRKRAPELSFIPVTSDGASGEVSR